MNFSSCFAEQHNILKNLEWGFWSSLIKVFSMEWLLVHDESQGYLLYVIFNFLFLAVNFQKIVSQLHHTFEMLQIRFVKILFLVIWKKSKGKKAVASSSSSFIHGKWIGK